MNTYAFPPPPQPSVPVMGIDALFPVRRILCVGRNYAAHRRELGGDDRHPPFFFAKPADAVVPPGGVVPFPTSTADLHHEIELVVAIDGSGSDLSANQAAGLIFGWAVGVDLTRRDLQAIARANGQPWEAAKGFDASAPISAIRPVEKSWPKGRIRLSVNGEVRQDALVSEMIWNVAEIIVEASRLWRLAAGDLIFTGTPQGVGPLKRGDVVEGELEDVGSLRFAVS